MQRKGDKQQCRYDPDPSCSLTLYGPKETFLDSGGYFYFHFAAGAKKPLYFEKLQTLIGYG